MKTTYFALVRKGDSGSMENIVFLEPDKIDSEPFTTSDVIAEFAGVNHHAIQQMISKYEKDLCEFGKVASDSRRGFQPLWFGKCRYQTQPGSSQL